MASAAHLSRKMQAFTTGHPDRLTVVQLPAYAPDVNPVDQLHRIQRQHSLITGFLGQTGLALEPEPPDTQTLAFQAL